MPLVLSVNSGPGSSTVHSDLGVTGIDKRPVRGPVEVRAPGPKGVGGSGLVGDRVCDLRHHGGDDQAVYAYAREDLDRWAAELGRELPSGVFGENLTTVDIDVNAALVGERWRIGERVELRVTAPRTPCRTFAGWLGERGWQKTFVRRNMPGAYLRVVRPGRIAAGDPLTVTHRPDHDVTVARVFRALTTEPELLPTLLVADDLPDDIRRTARRRTQSATM